jgi:Niemann-Pick C1 protein
MSFSFFSKHKGLMFAALLRRRSEPGLLAQYMQRYHAPILEIPEVKALVLAIFFGLLFTNITLLPQLSPGLEQKIVLPRDSYLQGYFDNITEYLRVGPPVYFVVKDYNYRFLIL